MKQQLIKDSEVTYQQLSCKVDFVGLCYKKQELSVEICQKASACLIDYKIVDEQYQLFTKHLLVYAKDYECKLILIYENSDIVAEKQAINRVLYLDNQRIMIYKFSI